jgi:hypothetical protein
MRHISLCDRDSLLAVPVIGRFLITVCAAMLLVLGGASRVAAQQSSDFIHPGDVWLDNRGMPIQAHGGGILHVGSTYFWFGEDRSQANDPDKRYVSCYSSVDLVHWTFRNQVLAITNPDGLGNKFILERPKVFYSRKRKTYVMYLHLDDSNYAMARVAIATSKTVDGVYTYRKSFRPFNLESRDIGQFIDEDGSAYLIFESRPSKGFYIAKLSDDRMGLDKIVSFVQAPLEGGAIAHDHGVYYVIGSHLTGWRPNPNVYATAPSLAGPWSMFENIAPPATNTYDSQSSMLLTISGSKATSVIYVGDRWTPKNLWDSRYIWMPLDMTGGRLALPPPEPWKINVQTGVVSFLPNTSAGSSTE